MSVEPRISLFLIGCVVGGAAMAAACARSTGASTAPASQPSEERSTTTTAASATLPGSREAAPPPEGLAVATFAGGCFWCMEPPFEKLEGVVSVVSGYTGGDEEQPTYKQVGYGRTGHAEAVRVIYDPDVVDYATLLDVFWRNIDPTDAGGQFADRGRHYRTAIFVHDEAQARAARASKKTIEAEGPFDEPIVTPIEEAWRFWVAEDYHQDYYRKNPAHYRRYRRGSGRGPFLERIWGSEHPKVAGASYKES